MCFEWHQRAIRFLDFFRLGPPWGFVMGGERFAATFLHHYMGYGAFDTWRAPEPSQRWSMIGGFRPTEVINNHLSRHFAKITQNVSELAEN